MPEEQPSPNEVRIRALTRLYYAKPAVQQALVEFAKNREVVPRFFEGFGKRPDTLQYPSDVTGLVQRGATSFHASEEIWHDPLTISSDMTSQELSELRNSWDLLIDIDSPYLDYSKIAGRLVVSMLEKYGVTRYGIKFSGSKGFHIIVPGTTFPSSFQGQEMRHMFPDWPRAITSFLLHEIRQPYNKAIIALGVNFAALEQRTKFSKENLISSLCSRCSNPLEKQIMVRFECSRCKTKYERPNIKLTKRKLRCIDSLCSGHFEVREEKEFFYCPKCKLSSIDKHSDSDKKVVYSSSMAHTGVTEELAAEKLGSLDLVLVSPRHLFRMPYSLHEKTSLASVVLSKQELENFTPKDADPLRVNVVPYYPEARPGEGTALLEAALKWKGQEETQTEKKRQVAYEKIALTGVTEDMFPAPIKKLLKGLEEGRKRGLFILITFLRCVGFPPEAIDARVHLWNTKNQPPLKEGYVKSQIDWHLKQKRQILPPNYDNESFYKDLNLLDKPPTTKNPVVEVARRVRHKIIN